MLLSNPSRSPILCKRRIVRASAITCSAPLRHNAIEIATGRREALAMLIGTGALLLQPQRSLAGVPLPGPPPGDGFRRHVDKLDGYSFNYPDTWINVTTSGNDVFFRNPQNLEENLFVEASREELSMYAATSLGWEASKRTCSSSCLRVCLCGIPSFRGFPRGIRDCSHKTQRVHASPLLKTSSPAPH